MNVRIVGYIILTIVLVILMSWGALSLFVRTNSPELKKDFGEMSAAHKALIVFAPDPLNNMDEQLCTAFAEALESKGWSAQIASVSTASSSTEKYDLYVFCANTYNFAPDHQIMDYIARKNDLMDKPVVLMTLGAGSTKKAQALIEERVEEKGALCLGSREYWLLKPNNLYRLDEPNVTVAIDMVKEFAREVHEEYVRTYSD